MGGDGSRKKGYSASGEGFEVWRDDCLEAMKRIAPESVGLVLADLPYGTTACPWDSVIDLPSLWASFRRVCRPGAAMVLTAQQPFTWRLAASNPMSLRHELIWEKPNGTNPFQARLMPMKKHENILVFCDATPVYNPQMEPGKPYKWNSRRTGGQAGGIGQREETPIDNKGTRFPGSVLRFGQERGLHPTQKPVGLMEWLVRTYSNEGDLVLDPTMGSGTSGVAALLAGRRFVGIESDQKHFSTALNRLGACAAGVAR
jgi:DNA modification methylase